MWENSENTTSADDDYFYRAILKSKQTVLNFDYIELKCLY